MRKKALPIIGVMIILVLCLSTPPSWGADSNPSRPDGTAIRPVATQSVRVGDIDVSYRVIGEGYPLILIAGYSATMDMWDPTVIRELSSRYQVILFDNRGIGRTTASAQTFTIGLFKQDTVGLMDALKIKKAHILGWSMGAFVAMEIALRHPERVNKLVLYAGNCGWKTKDVVSARPEVSSALMDLSGTPEERAKRLVSILFPPKWLQDHPDFLKDLPGPEAPPSLSVIERQGQAINGWAGVCPGIDKITQPTLIITGTEDVVIPPANALLMASRIPDSWLIRIPGGHSTMYQYPKTFSRSLLTFLEAER